MAETIEGLAALDFALGDLPKSTARATLVRAGKKALEPFIDDVRHLAPVDADPESTPNRPPGTLRDSYVIGTKLNKSQAKTARKEGKNFAEVYAGTNDPAGIQTEFGNAHQAPQPHARPAWDGVQKEVLDGIGTLLWDEIYKSAQRLARRNR
ncbi:MULTISPECIES: hypothetical protein [Sphingobium]|jgi:hypothetical protein|uniref:hypothetical protein n=1 Tax=Sphingobium TaxID=165695 RepID=UPI00038764AC|nr:hypothetical protein [Sphingobium sp. HDIP04]EQB03682.1 hypothetical protein L286_11700 [Sphingobium sp. HDIP04]